MDMKNEIGTSSNTFYIKDVYKRQILDYDYEKSGLHDYIASILEDINLEDEDSEYDFKGIHVWLSY